MTDREVTRLLTLLQVSDSAFPSGAFAFSNGLETLVSEGRVTCAEAVREVVELDVLQRMVGLRPLVPAPSLRR